MRSTLLLIVLLADAATADKDRFICPVDSDGGEYELTKAVWVPDTSVTKDASDYRTLALKVGATTLGSITTNSSGGDSWTAGTPVPFTLSGGKSLEFTANTDSIEIDSAHTGTTGKVADGRMILELTKIPV